MIKPSLYKHVESFLEGCPLRVGLPTNMQLLERFSTVLFRKTSRSIARSVKEDRCVRNGPYGRILPPIRLSFRAHPSTISRLLAGIACIWVLQWWCSGGKVASIKFHSRCATCHSLALPPMSVHHTPTSSWCAYRRVTNCWVTGERWPRGPRAWRSRQWSRRTRRSRSRSCALSSSSACLHWCGARRLGAF